jgi:hypothetical protein
MWKEKLHYSLHMWKEKLIMTCATHLLCLDELVVVTRVVYELALVREVNHVCADTVEEILGVRNEEENAGVVGELILQPHAGLHVQMVGRLVEEKHRRLQARENRDYLHVRNKHATMNACRE